MGLDHVLRGAAAAVMGAVESLELRDHETRAERVRGTGGEAQAQAEGKVSTSFEIRM